MADPTNSDNEPWSHAGQMAMPKSWSGNVTMDDSTAILQNAVWSNPRVVDDAPEEQEMPGLKFFLWLIYRKLTLKNRTIWRQSIKSPGS